MDHDFLAAITTAMQWQPGKVIAPVFHFQSSTAAAEKNREILQPHGFDLDKIIRQEPNSPLRPGSEFRPVDLLDPVFKGHPKWPRARQLLTRGAHFVLQPLPEPDRVADLVEAIEYSNQKTAVRHALSLRKILDKEVSKGWQLPVPLSLVPRIPGAIVAPLGMAFNSGWTGQATVC